VLGISGSPRNDSNTDRMVKTILRGASDAGHDTEFIKLNDLDFSPCQACNYCREKDDRKCKLTDDGAAVLDLTTDCDVLVFGSPIYMAGVSAQAKSYLDRWYSFKDANRITKFKRDRKVIGVYAQGAKDGTYHRLFESNERLFNSNNFLYLGTLVAPDYMVPEEGGSLLKKAYDMGNTL
jgi:multimeric flavodoxin WrbA